jgi:hypothetical protein
MTRHAVALALLVAVACLAPLGERAAAGVFSTPFTASNCAEPDVADASMADPDAFIEVDEGRCKALCKRAVSECKQFAKGAVSCIVGVAKSGLRYSIENCGVISKTPETLKACKASAATTYRSTRETALDDLPGALASCKAWGEACQTACMGKPL